MNYCMGGIINCILLPEYCDPQSWDGLAETSINSLNINIVWALRAVRGYLYCQDQDQKAFMFCVQLLSLFSYTLFLIWKSHQTKIQYFNFKNDKLSLNTKIYQHLYQNCQFSKHWLEKNKSPCLCEYRLWKAAVCCFSFILNAFLWI